jgi:tetratricopeptide (TPR) repeat protein
MTVAVVLAVATFGCTAQHQATTHPTTRLAATQANEPPEAYLSLDEIQPRPDLAELTPTTKPTTEPSLDAVELYARARGELGDGKRFNAINLLERAIQADPDSFAIRYDLGKAYAGVSSRNEQAIAAFEAAAKIKPDDIDVQTELGRQYLASDRPEQALTHLRLALQTSDYKADDDAAALVDFYLARALQQKGYDRAAVDQYDSLLKRLQRPTLAIRGNPELAYIAAHPEGLYLDVGRLYEKHEQYDLALRAYQFVEDRNPELFENHARVVNTLIELRKNDDAIQKAIALVDRYKANAESLALLKKVYKQVGREKEVVDELKKLQAQKPDDKTMLYALADTLYDFNRRDEAASLLNGALARDPKSLDIFRKLFGMYESRDETTTAAKLWIGYLAEHPDSLTELSPLWDKLTRMSRKGSIKLTDLQNLVVLPRAQGCKLFLVSRQAQAWNRDALARATLEQATKQRPIFPPAFRAEMADIWSRQEWDKPRKGAESDALVDAVNKEGDNGFAAELRGLSLLNQDDANRAIEAFAEATKLGNPSPDLQLTYALALRKQGNDQRFEQLLWKLMSDRPGYEQAYSVLFNYYDQKGADAQKRKVVTLWRAADPTNMRARLLEAGMILSSGAARGNIQLQAVEAILLEIFQDNPDQIEAIEALQSFYQQIGRLPEFVNRLENECQRDPQNRTALETLVGLYGQEKRQTDAARVLDASRAAMGNDPDLLYSIAHLYETIDQPQTTEEILAKVIQISPHHAAANNDLGYSWTDQGKNLDRAESMIRIAVDAEPDNESFLDSLGWVLYKRARFDEARVYFEKAVAPATFPDPVVLDHLGDTLYRLSENKLAKQRWDESMKRIETLVQIGAARDELMKLRLVLIGKIKQAEQGKPVTVAPTAVGVEKQEQAKN